jgi:DNA polymerase III sliding clamp (beta) subunit (PCNA family)
MATKTKTRTTHPATKPEQVYATGDIRTTVGELRWLMKVAGLLGVAKHRTITVNLDGNFVQIDAGDVMARTSVRTEGSGLVHIGPRLQFALSAVCKGPGDTAVAIGCGLGNAKVGPFEIPERAGDPPTAMPEGKSQPLVAVPADDWRDLVALTAPAVLTDDSRAPQLQRCKLTVTDGRVEMAATDSYRLHFGSRMADVEEGGEAIIPGTLCKAAAFVGGDVVVRTYESGHVSVGTAAWSFFAKPLKVGATGYAAGYPDYSKLVPTEYTAKAHLNALAVPSMLEALKIAEAFRTQSQSTVTAPVKLTQADADTMLVRLEAATFGSFQWNVPATFNGEWQMVAFKPGFLAQAISALRTAEVTIAVNGSQKPTVLSGGTDDRTVVMPVRVRES